MLFFETDKKNIKILSVSKSDKINSNCIAKLIVPVGSYNDGKLKGISHILEHILIVSLEQKYNISEFKVKGTTNLEYTEYQILCSQHNFKTGINLLIDLFNGTYLNFCDLESVRNDVLKEYKIYYKKINGDVELVELLGADTLSHLPIGTLENIYKISKRELFSFFEEHYKNNNAYIVAVGFNSNLFTKGTKCLTCIRDSIFKIEENCNASEKTFFSNINDTYKYYFSLNTNERCLEELSFYIIETYVKKFINFECLVEGEVSIRIIQYDSKKRYFYINLALNNSNKKEYFENKFISDLFTYLFENFNFCEFEIIKYNYLKKISKLKISNYDMCQEICSNILYGIPFFNKRKFLLEVKSIGFFEIKKFILNLINFDM